MAGAADAIQLPAAPGYIYPHAAGLGGGAADPSAWLTDIDPMNIAWDATKRPGLQALLNTLKNDTEPTQWTHADLRKWMKDDRWNSDSTIETRLRQLRFMESYPNQPVMLTGTLYQFLLSARLYLDVRKADGATPAAMALDLKVLRSVGDFLGLPRNVWPTSPPQPQVVREVMPRPEAVYDLLHAHWTPDYKRTGALEDAWVRHVLAAMFGLGCRPPKEYLVMRLDAYDPGSGLLKVVEPKKQSRERLLFVEPTWLAKSHSRPSLESWLRWRDRLQTSSARMFPNPVTGKDFPSTAAFTQFLHARVQPRFPWFHNYVARHWSVYARLIGSDGNLSDNRYNAVAEWHGHESVDMTRDVYGSAAKAYAKAYGVDWLSRAFAAPRSKNTNKEA